METAIDGVDDIRELPTYDVGEAARYLRMSASTLRFWLNGYRNSEPILRSPSLCPPRMLSFFNLVEAHVLSAMRRVHAIPLQRIRVALQTADEVLAPSPHPLIEHRFLTDGVDLFVERYGEHINLSRPKQALLRDMLETYLRRIGWDRDNTPRVLYPFSGTSAVDSRRTIVIDPTRSFGRRVIAGSSIATRIVAERYAAGETIAELSADYHLSPLAVEDAIRSEYELAAA